MSDRTPSEMESRRREKLAAVGGLAAGIAHEINTPIQFASDNLTFLAESVGQLLRLCGTYQGFCKKAAETRLSGDDLSQLRRAEEEGDLEFLLSNMPKAIDSALDGVTRVGAIARSLAAFAHPVREELTHADVNATIREALTIARNEIKYVATVDTVFGEVPAIPCMLSELKHALLMLLLEAAHELQRGSQSGHVGVIHVETRSEPSHVAISLAYESPTPTTSDVGWNPETLATVRSIVVDEHGGSLSLDDAVPGRRRATLCLPIDRSSVDSGK